MNKSKPVLITSFGFTLIGVLAVAIFMYFNFTTVVVSGNSMEPTFANRDRVLVTKAYWLVGGIKKKDIVVLRSTDGSPIIKRVYALSGESVDFYNVPDEWKLANGEYHVPENSVYVLGDNREVSEDSRKFGAVEESQIIGKVINPR